MDPYKLMQHCATCTDCTDAVFCPVGVQLLEEMFGHPVAALNVGYLAAWAKDEERGKNGWQV